MSKISRADSKARFRTGMYPTQADFENLHDSYVHKDDTIPLEQVGTNGATVVSLLNQKANTSHTHEIADVNGLQAFITKVNTFLDTVDASDDTINRWKEIEAFLQGITDTQTLAGLLANLRAEIVALIPEADTNSYLQLVADLDAYTDAPVGTIVKYTGQTNNKYTHGFDYEKVAGQGGATIPAGSYILEISENNSNANASAWAAENQGPFVYEGTCQFGEYGGRFYYPVEKPIVPGSRLYNLTTISDFVTVASVDGDTITTTEPSQSSYHSFSATPVTAGATTSFYRYVSPDGTVLLSYAWAAAGEKNTLVAPWDLLDEGAYWFNTGIRITQTSDDTVIPAPASWQPCKPMSVID